MDNTVTVLDLENIPLLSFPKATNNKIKNSPKSESIKLDIIKIAKACDLRKLRIYFNFKNITPEDRHIREEDILHRDINSGKNILHHIASFQGNPKDARTFMKTTLRIIKRIFNKKPDLGQTYYDFTNQGDENGDTPLYLAAKYKNVGVCSSLISYGMSDLDKKNNRGKTPIMKLFKKNPEVIHDFIVKFNKFSYYSDEERQTFALDFRFLVSLPTPEELEKDSCGLYTEMDFLANISYTPPDLRDQIILETGVKLLIWLKWQKFKTPYWLARFFQVIWYFLYSYFLISVYRDKCPYPLPSGNVYNFSWIQFEPSTHSLPLNETSFEHRRCTTAISYVYGIILITSALVDLIVIEGFPVMVRFKRKWYPMKRTSFIKYLKRIVLFFQIIHWFKMIFIISIFINTIPVLFQVDIFDVELQYVFASVGVFLSWFHIFLLLGKVPQLKGYIRMLTSIIYTLCIVGLMYLALIIAFGMVFSILMPGNEKFASVFESFFRMLFFTIGEVNYEETFYGDGAKETVCFIATVVFYGVAILILHIVLLNFLITLTINELRDISKKSEIWKLYTYLWQIYLFENFLSSFPYSLRFLKKQALISREYMDGEVDPIFKVRNIDLPKSLRQELRDLNLSFHGKWE